MDSYWQFIKPANLTLEKSLDALDRERLRRFDAREWYEFLSDEYFRWKYTDPRRYATTTRQLKRYLDKDSLDALDQIGLRVLKVGTDNIRAALSTACDIRGLGTAGASGLLAVMYPDKFGTVDQFLGKALPKVEHLPEAAAVARMNPESLTIEDGVLLTNILRRKAADLNRLFETNTWTPRKMDKVVWHYGR